LVYVYEKIFPRSVVVGHFIGERASANAPNYKPIASHGIATANNFTSARFASSPDAISHWANLGRDGRDGAAGGGGWN
jgi:hypothetical protein